MQAGLKTKLFQTSAYYLGHVLDANGVHVDPRKVSAIQSWLTPTNAKQVCQLLGTFGYYRRFIKDYADIATLLNKLLAKDVEFVWTPECETAANELKQRLCTAPVLKLFNEGRPTILMTDASDFGIGAVLEQEQPDERHLIEFMSKQLNDAQHKYKVQNKELFAIVESLDHWHHYLAGWHVVVEMDHHPLKYIKT